MLGVHAVSRKLRNHINHPHRPNISLKNSQSSSCLKKRELRLIQETAKAVNPEDPVQLEHPLDPKQGAEGHKEQFEANQRIKVTIVHPLRMTTSNTSITLYFYTPLKLSYQTCYCILQVRAGKGKEIHLITKDMELYHIFDWCSLCFFSGPHFLPKRRSPESSPFTPRKPSQVPSTFHPPSHASPYSPVQI